MDTLILVLILIGSVLMVFNIVRYAIFIKKNYEMDHNKKNAQILLVAFLFLVFFLIGYIVVAVSGIADIVMALILLGGSFFVFLLNYVMFTIIGRSKSTEHVLSARYEEMKSEVAGLTKNSLAAFHVNLTRDEVEERRGKLLYPSDIECSSYTELLESRKQYVIDRASTGTNQGLFTREGLLKHYQEGHSVASEVLLVKNREGMPSFVSFEATLQRKPGSDDIIAFINEKSCDEDVLKEELMERILMNQYDRIAYIVEGNYKVLSSNAGKKEGLLIRDDEEDSYESIYLNCFLPALDRTCREATLKTNPLRLSVIEKELADKDRYEVDLPFIIDGQQSYKHFMFYAVNRKARYYLMLLSDSAKYHDKADHEPDKEESRPQVRETAAEAVRIPEPKKPEPRTNQPEEEPVPPLKLLVVDDNIVNRELANLLLSSEGHTVDLTENGKEAFERVRDTAPGTYDVVLMDVNMPVMNGYEATRAIRELEDPARKGIPIIAMTANAFAEDQKAAFDAGMDGFVTKPITPAAIRKVLLETVRRS